MRVDVPLGQCVVVCRLLHDLPLGLGLGLGLCPLEPALTMAMSAFATCIRSQVYFRGVGGYFESMLL